MATSTDPTRSHVAVPSLPPEGRKAKPFKWFAAFGGLCLVIQAYLFTRWFVSGNFKPTPSGPDPIPRWMSIGLHVHEVVFVGLFAFCVYRYVVKPWRRERRIPILGMLVLGMMTTWWLDLSANYLNMNMLYNSGVWFNRGSWYNFIPGWVSPRAEHLVEPWTISFTGNLWATVFCSIFLAFCMRKAKARWPQLGTVGVLAVAVALFIPIDLIFETFWLRIGLYAYPGAIPAVTLWEGEYYQFPLHETLLLTFFMVAYASLVYFKDDKGRSIIERGIDEIRAAPHRRGLLRFLAWAGACNLIFLLYALNYALISVLPSFRWSEEIVTNRSYLRNQVCGAGTTYACPSADIPIPRDGGIHVSPDGKLVVP